MSAATIDTFGPCLVSELPSTTPSVSMSFFAHRLSVLRSNRDCRRLERELNQLDPRMRDEVLHTLTHYR